MSYTLTGNPDLRFWPDVFKRTGAVRESVSRIQAYTNTTTYLTNGKMQFQAISLTAGDIITNAIFALGSTVSVLPTNGWMALFDSTSRNCIRQSTDQLTVVWGASAEKTLALDSVPVTAGARVASTTVTLTFPTLNQSISTLFAVNDSIVVSNANIAQYNGTFTVTSVSGQTITYVSGGSATDNLAAPFPTVQLAAGKRTYSVPTSGMYYLVCAQACSTSVSSMTAFPTGNVGGASAPILIGHDQTNTITGTAISPAAALTGDSSMAFCYVS